MTTHKQDRAGGKVTEHKQDGAPSYYTDQAGRICDKQGFAFRDKRSRGAR